MNKEIIPGTGLDELKFGLTRDEVKQQFGEPDEIEQYADEDTDEVLNEAWHYDDLELSISFDKDENWKMSTISVSDASFKIAGKEVIGLTKEELDAFISANDFGNGEMEEWSIDDEETQHVLTIEDKSINFWFNQGKVSEIQWGPLYDSEDNTIWPN